MDASADSPRARAAATSPARCADPASPPTSGSCPPTVGTQPTGWSAGTAVRLDRRPPRRNGPAVSARRSFACSIKSSVACSASVHTMCSGSCRDSASTSALPGVLMASSIRPVGSFSVECDARTASSYAGRVAPPAAGRRIAPDTARHAGWSHYWQTGGPMTVAKPCSKWSHQRGGRHPRRQHRVACHCR